MIQGTELARRAIKVIRATQTFVEREVENARHMAFKPVELVHKTALDVDVAAERVAMANLWGPFKGKRNIELIGEEAPPDPHLDLATETRMVALLDMVDGTDLLARGLGNWCSAMVFFQQGAILGSFVGLPGRGVYYALAGEDGAFFKPFGTSAAVRLGGPNKAIALADASLCFYGQKPRALLAALEHPGFRAMLTALNVANTPSRIYTLAGNPMMVKVVDRESGMVPIDAVFELRGQAAHDVVPGAYIAQKAGAIVTDLDGEPLDYTAFLNRPGDRNLRYIIAANEGLSRELVEALKARESPTDRLSVIEEEVSPPGSSTATIDESASS